ncbi:hypothetical protein WMW72_26160 [Paenibacillus filicis]|uniref:Uncharacterized protein n=1 Tax=Paenibacillus filicis TaxID=669464 RepID=A0ABU9DRR5_9BACL
MKIKLIEGPMAQSGSLIKQVAPVLQKKAVEQYTELQKAAGK